jgi:hypothetical protein
MGLRLPPANTLDRHMWAIRTFGTVNRGRRKRMLAKETMRMPRTAHLRHNREKRT